MDFMKALMDQHMIAMMGEIVLFANTVTMAMPTRWRGNMFMDIAVYSTLAMILFRKEQEQAKSFKDAWGENLELTEENPWTDVDKDGELGISLDARLKKMKESAEYIISKKRKGGRNSTARS